VEGGVAPPSGSVYDERPSVEEEPLGAVTVLLGPQRFDPFVASVLDDLGVDGPVATVTAGWQEREGENDELREHCRRPTDDLALYRRAEEVFRDDPELFEALRARQDRLRDLQQIYRRRLDAALGSARDLFVREGDPTLLDPERSDAVAAVRRLDAHHLERVRATHDEFAAAWRPRERAAVAAQRRDLEVRLRRVGAVLVAGGHVAILLNRLRLFGLLDLAHDLPVVAWSAGAMAMTERIVLFHDSPPQGAGNAEVLDAGLGRCDGIVVLPHASRRLRLDDRTRVSIFALRMAPSISVAFDPGARVDVEDGRWRPGPGTRALHPGGDVREAGSW
jgi:hypothetical protein